MLPPSEQEFESDSQSEDSQLQGGSCGKHHKLSLWHYLCNTLKCLLENGSYPHPSLCQIFCRCCSWPGMSDFLEKKEAASR